MKKFLMILLASAAVAAGAAGLSACAPKEVPHEHSYGEWETVTPATCSARGTEHRLCECGEEEVRFTDKLEHTPVAVEAVEPTCTTAGRTAGSECSVCGEALEASEELAALGHVFSEWYNTVQAHCDAEGEEARDCLVCEAHETRSVAKTAHLPVTVAAVPANCLNPGVEAGKRCGICGEVLEGLTPVPALGHQFGEWKKVKDATCNDHGVEVAVCGRCNEETERGIDPLGHTFSDWETTVPSSCNKAGTQQSSCDRCGETQVRELAPTAHTPVPIGEEKPATCTDPGLSGGQICSICHEILQSQTTIPALGHDLSYTHATDEVRGDVHDAVCGRADCGFTERRVCSFDVEITPATCTKAEHHKHSCTVCGYSYEHDDDENLALGHDYGPWIFDYEAYEASLSSGNVVRRHYRVCTHAGHEADEGAPDVVDCTEEANGPRVAPTCQKAGYTPLHCPGCGNEYLGKHRDPIAHQYEVGEYKSFVYTGRLVHTQTCTMCGQDRMPYSACRMQFKDSIAATCETDGVSIYECLICKRQDERITVTRFGHSYGAYEHVAGTEGEASMHVQKCQHTGCTSELREPCHMVEADLAPTCVSAGSDGTVCELCLHTENTEIAALGHEFEGVAFTPNGRHTQHSRKCTRCEQDIFEDCVYEDPVVIDPDCTTNGTETFTCKFCEDSYTQIWKPATGHEAERWEPTEDGSQHTAYCVTCRKQVTEGHDFSETNLCARCHKDGIVYEQIPDTSEAMVVRAGNLPSKTVTIADTWNGMPVTMIRSNAFSRGNGTVNNTDLVHLVMPLSIRSIGTNAFALCTALEDVRYAEHTAGEANVEAALERIEYYAFWRCSSLAQAVFPVSLKYIGANAFEDCVALADIVIPESVTEIDGFAFRNTAYYNDTGHWTDGALYIGSHLIRANPVEGYGIAHIHGDYTVRDNTLSISDEAFKDCKELTSVTLPASLKVVDKNAFSGCEALAKVVFRGTFQQYLNIHFDNDLASPMHYASELTIEGAKDDIHIPETLQTIPSGAFRGTEIGSIEIPASVTSIGANAFKDCAHLETVVLHGNSLVSVGAEAFHGTPFYDDPENWENGVLYLKNDKGEPIALLDAEDDKGLPAEVTIGATVQCIAERAFEDCRNLTRVVFPADLLVIGAGAFKGCTNFQRADFVGTGRAWFCFRADGFGRVLRDEALSHSGGVDGEAAETYAARLFSTLYDGQWRRIDVSS